MKKRLGPIRLPPGVRSRQFETRTTRLLLFGLLPTCLLSSVGGMTASPEVFTEYQPDGTRISLLLRGDERRHWMTDIEGASNTSATNSMILLAPFLAKVPLTQSAIQIILSPRRWMGLLSTWRKLKKGEMFDRRGLYLR